MAEQVLILSPHCDDAPLSLGASLVARLLGTTVRVVVIFSRSSYTRLEGCTAPVRRTTALRITEERRAARAAGYKATFLPFPEPFVRPGYRTLGDVLDRRRRPEQEANWAAVRDSLLQIMRPHQGPILAPLGCGDHIDHRAVTACFRMSSPFSMRICHTPHGPATGQFAVWCLGNGAAHLCYPFP